MSTAFIFPGQGSQSIGMLAELAASHPIIEQTFSEASEILNYDLWSLTQNGPKESLDSTDKTQPAMLTAGVAVWRLWQQSHEQSDAQLAVVMAGHSLGEYTALVCSGALQFADAVSLVEKRGLFMQQAVASGEGAMAAILGLEDDAVLAMCETFAKGQVLEAVNFNSPGQVVIAGNAEAVKRAIAGAADLGAKKAIALPVSVPSHCALMKPAAEQLKDALSGIQFSIPEVPVLHNTNAKTSQDVVAIKQALVDQLFQPVLWVKTINTMLEDGVTDLVECGPGKVLAGLNKRISRRTPVFPIFDSASFKKVMAK